MKKGLSQDQIQPFIIEKSLFPNLFAQTPSSRYATLREPSFPYGDGLLLVVLIKEHHKTENSKRIPQRGKSAERMRAKKASPPGKRTRNERNAVE